jgi:hypothetical protein
MRISKVMAVAVSGCALGAAAMVPAIAGTGHHAVPATKQFKSTLSTHSPKPGQKITLIGHGAKKSTQYQCVFVVLKGSAYTIGPIKPVKSNKSGKVKCTVTYKPYTAVSLTGGKSHHCPLSKKDKKAGYKCGLAVSTQDKTSATIQYFSPKK